MINVYVVWRQEEDQFYWTLLEYENSPMQAQAMQQWSVADYVAQAFDAEYPKEEFETKFTGAFECIGIFQTELPPHFIY